MILSIFELSLVICCSKGKVYVRLVSYLVEEFRWVDKGLGLCCVVLGGLNGVRICFGLVVFWIIGC